MKLRDLNERLSRKDIFCFHPPTRDNAKSVCKRRCLAIDCVFGNCIYSYQKNLRRCLVEMSQRAELLGKSTISDISEGLLLIYVFIRDGYEIFIVFKTQVCPSTRFIREQTDNFFLLRVTFFMTNARNTYKFKKQFTHRTLYGICLLDSIRPCLAEILLKCMPLAAYLKTYSTRTRFSIG